MADALRPEFDRQLENLVAKGYPELAGLTAGAFAEQMAPLRGRLSELGERANGAMPFVIVVSSEVVPAKDSMAQVELRGKRGYVGMHPTEPVDYGPIDELEVPDGAAYLAVDVDPGASMRNVTPDDALETIRAQRRSPLTIDEGVAVVTHHPEVLEHGTAFSILGSRRGDRRVPALWVSSGRPRLGWCWAGNPHTWLGSASCATRLGAHW
jgi:Family of unknown function (DUF5701)